MKTPDEIKKLLANHKNYIYSAEELFADALSCIRELEAELEAAKERESGLSIMLTSAQSAAETYKGERDQYWDYIKGMECESCSGDCDKCDGQSGWTWSGELSQNADS